MRWVSASVIALCSAHHTFTQLQFIAWSVMGINVSLVYLRRYDTTLNWLLSSTLTCVQRRTANVTRSKLRVKSLIIWAVLFGSGAAQNNKASSSVSTGKKIIPRNCSSKICSFDIHKVKLISWCEKRSEPRPRAFRLRCSTVKAITVCGLLYSLFFFLKESPHHVRIWAKEAYLLLYLWGNIESARGEKWNPVALLWARS